MTYITSIDAAVDIVVTRCKGAHTQKCAWHSVMAVDENHAESGFTYEPEYVENALAIIDSYCNCEGAH